MKRLKNIMLKMEQNTKTYKQIYEGAMLVYERVAPKPFVDYQNIYYRNDVGYEIQVTNKLAWDKPTVTISISIEKLGITSITPNAADFFLRQFAKFIDPLNAELYNRSRTDKANGKYYLYSPSGEVLIRNSAYFKMLPQKDYNNGSGTTVYMIDDDIIRLPQMCLCIKLMVQLPEKRLKKLLLC